MPLVVEAEQMRSSECPEISERNRFPPLIAVTSLALALFITTNGMRGQEESQEEGNTKPPVTMTLAMAASIAEYQTKSGVISRNEPFVLDDPAVARVLAKTNNELQLGGLRHLSPEVARELSYHGTGNPPHRLVLGGLTELSPQAALEIARHKNLDFPKLDPSLETLKALCQQEGALSLSAIKQLLVDQAQVLATHHGSLLLRNVTELSEEAALQLAKSKQLLKLPEIQQLTFGSEQAFAATEMVLELPKLKQVA